MERIQQRINSAERALVSFNQLIFINRPDDVERDASTQRFAYTYEACWMKITEKSDLPMKVNRFFVVKLFEN